MSPPEEAAAGRRRATWAGCRSRPGANGTGNGTVGFTVAANSGPGRQGTLTIGGRTFTVSQAENCSFAISPGQVSVPAASGTTNVTVTSPAGCGWTHRAAPAGSVSARAAPGTANGTVRLAIQENSAGTAVWHRDDCRTGVHSQSGERLFLRAQCGVADRGRVRRADNSRGHRPDGLRVDRLQPGGVVDDRLGWQWYWQWSGSNRRAVQHRAAAKRHGPDCRSPVHRVAGYGLLVCRLTGEPPGRRRRRWRSHRGLRCRVVRVDSRESRRVDRDHGRCRRDRKWRQWIWHSRPTPGRPEAVPSRRGPDRHGDAGQRLHVQPQRRHRRPCPRPAASERFRSPRRAGVCGARSAAWRGSQSLTARRGLEPGTCSSPSSRTPPAPLDPAPSPSPISCSPSISSRVRSRSCTVTVVPRGQISNLYRTLLIAGSTGLRASGSTRRCVCKIEI